MTSKLEQVIYNNSANPGGVLASTGAGTASDPIVPNVGANGTFDFCAQMNTAASAHGAATVLGGLQSTVVSSVASGGVQISNVSVFSKTGLTNPVDIYFFRSQPSFTGNDGDSFTLSDADKLLMPSGSRVTVAPSVSGSLATQALGAASQLGLCMKTDANSKIWWVAVATVSTTPASTSEYQVSMSGLSDKGV
jgi:hypothetical protein